LPRKWLAGQQPYLNYCWQYDSFGNRLWLTGSATAYSTSNGGGNSCPVGSGPSFGASFNGSNQISDGLYLYDAAGNIRSDSTTGNSYLYDGEGRICAVQQSIDGITNLVNNDSNTTSFDSTSRQIRRHLTVSLR
jgi:hypothetical protein